MRKINIIHLHVIYNNYYTGIDKYIEMYKKGMQKNSRIQTHCIFLTDSKKKLFSHITFQNGVVEAIIPMPMQDKLFFKKETFWKTKYWKVIIEIMTPYLKGMENVIFHAHNTFLIDLADLFKKQFGGKTVYHLHCLPWKYQYNNNTAYFNKLYSAFLAKDYVGFRNLEDECIRYEIVDKIICLSQVAKQYLMMMRQIPNEKIEIIENGLLPTKIIERNVNDNIVEILFAGKVSDDKGIFELLKALLIVHDKGYKFKLIIAGTCMKRIKDRIYNIFGMLDIQILGQLNINELYNLYTTCMIGVVPSLYEQCSYVALEMSMFGVPIIVSDIDALSEMFEDEMNALKTPLTFDGDFGLELDKEKLANAIIRLINDKALRLKLSTNAIKNYQERFTLEKMIENTINVYEQLIEQDNA